MKQVVGIDVSKAHLDGFCLASGRRLAATNDAQGIGELALWLEPGSLVVMEASGGYERLDAAVIARTGAFAKPATTPMRVGAREQLAELLAYRALPDPPEGCQHS